MYKNEYKFANFLHDKTFFYKKFDSLEHIKDSVNHLAKLKYLKTILNFNFNKEAHIRKKILT